MCDLMIASDWSAWGAGLIGALIGGFFALGATLLAAHFSKTQSAAARRAVVVGGVKAIGAELAVNFRRFEQQLAPTLRGLGANEYLAINWPIQSEYFGVYAANAGLLGELGDDALAEEIIETVTAGKGLVDSLRLNVQMVKELEAARVRGHDVAGVPLAAELAAREQLLVAYAAGLRSIDVRLAAGVASLGPKISALK